MSWFEKLEKAIRFTKSILDIGSSFTSNGRANEGSRHNDRLVEEKVQEASRQIRETIKTSTQAIIDKIESDKLEELNSRVANLALVLKFEKQSDILNYVLLTRESIHYAENRIQEGKKHWIGPCLIAKSAVLMILQRSDLGAEAAREELEKFCMEAKHEMLDLLVPKIFNSGRKIPWEKIQRFLSDSDSKESGLLLTDEHGTTAELASTETFEIKIKSKYNGQITWTSKIGDRIKKGDKIASVAIFALFGAKPQPVISQNSGTLTKILKASNQTIFSGEDIAVIMSNHS